MGSHWRLLSPILGKGVRLLTLNIKTADMNFQATFLLQLSSSWHLISIQLCLYNAFKCNIFRRQLSYSFIMSLVLTWFSGRCEKFRKPKTCNSFWQTSFLQANWWSPSKFGRNVARTKGYKIMSAFFFPFSIALFLFFLCLFCFLFLIICLLNANIFLLEAAECKFILKKLIWFQGNAYNSSKIGFLWLKLCSYFSREIMFDTLSFRRKSVPPCSSCCGFKTFRRRIGEKVKQKQDCSTPPSSSIPMHMIHRVTKAVTFFWLVSLNFFLLLFSCLCTGMLRMVFFFFLFFLSLFLLIFFLHAFCSKLD